MVVGGGEEPPFLPLIMIMLRMMEAEDSENG
jgi:hypothetical protein